MVIERHFLGNFVSKTWCSFIYALAFMFPSNNYGCQISTTCVHRRLDSSVSALWGCSNKIVGQGVNIGFAYEEKTIESLSPKFGVV